MLPFFDTYSLPLIRVLTDRGTEYRGSIENHPYPLFLYLNDIEHTRTKARNPQTNGRTDLSAVPTAQAGRFNQTLPDEFYKIAFRKKIYTSLEDIQADLDGFLNDYNTKRTNHGKYYEGRTSMETFTESLDLCRQYVHYRMEVDGEAA